MDDRSKKSALKAAVLACGSVLYMRGIFASKAKLASVAKEMDKALDALEKRVIELEAETP
jgi:hypothetical protein